jgi:hypothetical protein
MIVLMRSSEAKAVPRFPTLGQLTSRDSILVVWTRNDAGGSYEVHFSSENLENNLELPNAIWLIPATSELFKLWVKKFWDLHFLFQFNSCYIGVPPLCVSMSTSFIIITISLKPHY